MLWIFFIQILGLYADARVRAYLDHDIFAGCSEKLSDPDLPENACDALVTE